MGELEPGAGEGIRVCLRVLAEALDDLAVGRILLERDVGGEHDRRVPLGRIVGIGHEGGGRAVARNPLDRAGGAPRLHPVEAEQEVEIHRGPGDGVGGPGALEAAGDRVGALAGVAGVGPAEALLLQARGCGFGTHASVGLARAVRLAEGVAAGDQRDGLLVVHGHAAEGLANVPRGGERVGRAVRALRIHVDEAHLNGCQRTPQLALAAMTFVGKKLLLGTPVGEVGLPVVHAAAGKAEGLEAHGLQRHVTGEYHEVGPGDLLAVLLLDRPQQALGLVEVHVVGPAVERIEAELAAICAAAAVEDAVRTRAVPGHADEQRAVVAVVSRPPVLRVCHQCMQILFQGFQVEFFEFFSIVERLSHGVRQGSVLVQDFQIQLVRPPVPVCRASAGLWFAGMARHRAFAFFTH